MKTNYRKCDRCGTIFNRNTSKPYWRYTKMLFIKCNETIDNHTAHPYIRKRKIDKSEHFDFCPKCEKDFEKFINRKELENGK